MKKKLLLFSLFISGCASQTIYHWGEYQNLIYTQYKEPGKVTPEYQIEKMEADIQISRSNGKPLPPGFYAHLGYQYLQTGNTSKAKQYFLTEKKMFPESATLMDRFLVKLK